MNHFLFLLLTICLVFPSVFGFSTPADTISDSWSTKKECSEVMENYNKRTGCIITAKWVSNKYSECFVIDYIKSVGSAFSGTKDVRCTKSPCANNVKTSVDCAAALGARLSKIPQ